MSTIKVQDSLIWSSHIADKTDLANKISDMNEGEMIELEVASHTGVWEKVSNNSSTGQSVPAIKPLFSAKENWNALQRDQSVGIRMTGDQK